MATIQVVLLNGTTADANEVMEDFNEIYDNIDNSNIAAGAGITFSKLDSATVAGVTATQTLTNKTLTSPTINTPTISGGTFTGTPTFSGLPTFSVGINIASGQKIGVDGGGASPASYLNGTATTLVGVAGGNTVFTANSSASTLVFGGAYNVFTGSDFIVPAASKIRFDGSATGDTYIYEEAANNLWAIVGGSVGFKTNASLFITGNDFAVQATNKVFLDGGGDTYIYESSANNLRFEVGGNNSFEINGSGNIANFNATEVALNPTKRLFLDGGGNTYIYESSADNLRFEVGGNNAFEINGSSNLATFNATQVALNPTKALFFDGGSDTYILEASANVLQFVAGGTEFMRSNASGEIKVGASLSVPTANYANQNSFAKAWGYFNSAGTAQATYNVTGNAAVGAAGTFTVTLPTPFATANYVVIVSANGPAGGIDYGANVEIVNSSSFNVQTYSLGAGNIHQDFSFVAYGAQ